MSRSFPRLLLRKRIASGRSIIFHLLEKLTGHFLSRSLEKTVLLRSIAPERAKRRHITSLTLPGGW
jgi:hypothetical protein